MIFCLDFGWRNHIIPNFIATKPVKNFSQVCNNASVNSSCAQPPFPPGYWGAFTRLVSPGGGAFANFVPLRGRAVANPKLLTHAVSYQNITTQRILLEKQADWLICQGRQNIEEAYKGMFSILCMHFFIA